MRGNMEALLEVTGLRVWLGQREIVRGVTLTVPQGATVALVGESGSGKTTLLRALMGLLPAEATVEGSVRLRGGAGAGSMSLLHGSAQHWRTLRRRYLAWIPQEPQAALDPRRSAGAHLRECLGRGAQAGEAARLMHEVGLDPERGRDYPHQWSGGMQQRLLVAMALARRPRLLLADEPTSALDTLHQAQLLALLRRVREEESLSLLLVTHDLAVAATLADDVCVMADGAILEQGPVRDVFAHPRTAEVARMVAGQPGNPRRKTAGGAG